MSTLDYAPALGPGILAFTSDRSVDFHHGDPERPERFSFTDSQASYLDSCGISRPDNVVFSKQVHGSNIWQVTAKEANWRGRFEADAVVTAEVNIPIAVRTADCAPLLLHDPVKGVIAAVHAGWKSTKLQIVAKTIELMRSKYGVRPTDLRVAIGPCIRRDNCQVGLEFREFFPHDVMETPRGLYLDLAGANIRQLVAARVRLENIHDCGLCTVTEADRFFSYRREGAAAGRMINLIMKDR